MPHCDSFYKALDKKLEQKMTIDDIANELCNKTKDPRRNMILDIKEHKGEDWLITNADWLGYHTDKLAGGIARGEQVHAAMNYSIESIPNICDASPSVVPEATVSDKVVKDKVIDPITELHKSIPVTIVPIETVPKIGPIVKTVPKKVSDVVTKNCIIGKEKIKEKKKNNVGELEEIELCPCKGFGYLIKGDKWFIIRLSGREDKQIKSLERKTSIDVNCVFCQIELCPCGDFGYNIADDLWLTIGKIHELRNSKLLGSM